MQPAPQRSTSGLAYGIAAYAFWGVIPIYWKYLSHVPALEVVAHRTFWGGLAFSAILWARGRMSELLAAMRDGRTLLLIALSALLLGANWLIFIYAVASERVLQASLGYFINPLVSILLGVTVLGERMSRAKTIAVILAALGVAQLALLADELPWIALVLASTFGVYGLMRKTVRVDALPGSTLEGLLLLPAGAAYLVYLAAQGSSAWQHSDTTTNLLLAASGFITAAPLLWFTNAARRLPLYMMGFLQYIAPSLQFTLAVAVYREPFTSVHMRSFACIWLGLAIVSFDSWRTLRRPASAQT